MENYIVSARKYRPSTFDTVVGQTSITTTLKNAVKNKHLAQAFLFCGPRGVGKTTCARILAKTINCENLSPDIEPCNECESCRSFNESSSFNIHELDAASNNSVDDIRALVDRVRIPPQVGTYKVYIIDEVHMLSSQAFNAFLKTLEEPPAHAKFILATTEKHKIIPTILSRCQIYDFKRITVEDIVQHLQFVAKNENIEVENEALHIIAQKADGALRDALSIFDQLVSFAGESLTYKNVIDNLNVLDYEYYFRLTDSILQHDYIETLLIVDEIIENGFDGQHLISGLSGHFRDLLVSRNEKTAALLETSDSIRERYLHQSRQCPPALLLEALDVANRFDLSFKESNNKKLHLEIAMLKLTQIDSVKSNAIAEKKTGIPDKKVEKRKTGSTSEQKKEPAIDKPAEEKPGSKKNEGYAASSVSIKDAYKPKADKKTEDKIKEEGSGYKKRENFSQDTLVKAWQEHAQKYKSTIPNLFVTLTERKPVLRDDFVVEYEVDNKTQMETINEKKSGIIEDLRSRLKNDKVMLDVKITEKQEKKRNPYSPDEKYKRMAEKNPAIRDFRNQLGLDIEF